jgi:hypothetical protein
MGKLLTVLAIVGATGNLYNSVVDKPIATGLWGKWFRSNECSGMSRVAAAG